MNRAAWRREIAENIEAIRRDLVAIITAQAQMEASQDTLENTTLVANKFRDCDKYEAQTRSMLMVVAGD